jgi:hypothetical protein
MGFLQAYPLVIHASSSIHVNFESLFSGWPQRVFSLLSSLFVEKKKISGVVAQPVFKDQSGAPKGSKQILKLWGHFTGDGLTCLAQSSLARWSTPCRQNGSRSMRQITLP